MSDPKTAAATNTAIYDSAAQKKVEELKKFNSSDKTSSAAEQKVENLIEVPTECIPVNISLPCTVYLQTHGKYLVFKRQGEKINYKQALEMQKKGTTAVFIHKVVWTMLKESLKDLAMPETASNESEQIIYMRHLLLAYGTELEKKQTEDQRPMLEKMRKQGELIAEALIKSPAAAAQLLRPASTVENYFLNHPINVCIWAVLIGQKLGLNAVDLKTIGAAAYLHDIGTTLIPKRVLMKKEVLNEDEEEMFQSHSRKGAELINDYGFPPVLATIIEQHQERPNGKGYPNGLRDKDINPFAKIISVADNFDDLTSNRPQGKALSSTEALATMKQTPGEFEARALEALAALLNP